MVSKAALQPELQVQVQDNHLLQQRKCSVKVWRQVEQVVEILKKDDIHSVSLFRHKMGSRNLDTIFII